MVTGLANMKFQKVFVEVVLIRVLIRKVCVDKCCQDQEI